MLLAGINLGSPLSACMFYLSTIRLDLAGLNLHNADIFMFNPLSPHDASKHHFTSLKTDLLFL